MKWNAEYSARRYFRRLGATIDTDNKMVVFNTPPPRENLSYKKHMQTLAKLGYCFTESLFINL